MHAKFCIEHECTHQQQKKINKTSPYSPNEEILDWKLYIIRIIITYKYFNAKTTQETIRCLKVCWWPFMNALRRFWNPALAQPHACFLVFMQFNKVDILLINSNIGTNCLSARRIMCNVTYAIHHKPHSVCPYPTDASYHIPHSFSLQPDVNIVSWNCTFKCCSARVDVDDLYQEWCLRHILLL